MSVLNPYKGKKLWRRLALYLGLILGVYVVLTASLQVIIGRYYLQDTTEKATLISRAVETQWREDIQDQARLRQGLRGLMADITTHMFSDLDAMSDASLRGFAAPFNLEDWAVANRETGEVLYADDSNRVGESLVIDEVLAALLDEGSGTRHAIELIIPEHPDDYVGFKGHAVYEEMWVLTLFKQLDVTAADVAYDWAAMFAAWLNEEHIMSIAFNAGEQVWACDALTGCATFNQTAWPLKESADTLRASGEQVTSFRDDEHFNTLHVITQDAETTGFVHVTFTRNIMNLSLRLLYVTAGTVMTALMTVVMVVVVYSSNLRAHAYERSISDPVTGAYNRTAWVLHAEKEARLSMMRMNLKGFDHLVTLYGEEFRETILKTICERLWTRFPTLRLYRLDNDHLVFASFSHNPSFLYRLAEQIALVVHENLTYGEMTLNFECKFGILMASDRPESPALAMRALLSALQAAERTPRQISRLYDRALRLESDRETQIYHTLHRTLTMDAGEAIHVVYQAQFNSKQADVITGFEVLARLKVNGLGWVSPSEFIPLAERRGLIGLLGREVLHKTCQLYQTLQARYDTLPTFSINASVIELTQSDYASQFIKTLEAYNVPPSALYVELTETAFAQNREALIKTLDKLKAAGLRMALDDFGAGYSSLAYLTSLNIDRIKIDRAFIVSMETDSSAIQVIRSVVEIARSIDAEVLAEGIETEGQLERVKTLGVTSVQGYLLQRPIDQTTLLQKLDVQKRLLSHD